MENARFTALFLIAVMAVLYYVTFGLTPPIARNVEEAVKNQGTNFKGTDNTRMVEVLPPLSIPIPNVSANCYAGSTPRI